MNKKEERLSHVGRRLLMGARQRATDPVAAFKYLLSVPASDLPPYDRRKIGREILRRLKTDKRNSRARYLGTNDFNSIIQETVDETLRRESEKKQPRFRYFGASDRDYVMAVYDLMDPPEEEQYLFPKRRLEWSHRMRRDMADAIRYEREGKLQEAIRLYRSYHPSSLGVKSSQYGVNPSFVKLVDEGLERVLAKQRGSVKDGVSSTIAIVGVLSGLFFLSSNITGNAIANISQSSGNILGAVLLVVGLVAGFFWVKKK